MNPYEAALEADNMEILVCVGSSCHLKGSYDVIRRFEELIRENGLDERVVLKASFCMGHCTGGVAVKIDGAFIDGVTPETMDSVFRRHVLAVPGLRDGNQSDDRPLRLGN